VGVMALAFSESPAETKFVLWVKYETGGTALWRPEKGSHGSLFEKGSPTKQNGRTDCASPTPSIDNNARASWFPTTCRASGPRPTLGATAMRFEWMS
jgi:hypothetical protein